MDWLSSATITLTIGIFGLTIPAGFFLAPLLSPKTTPSKISWIPASNGEVPANSLKGGEEKDGTSLFICRAPYRNGLHPGKLVSKNCSITYGGIVIPVSSYEVLTGLEKPDWQFASNGQILPGTLSGGQELDRRLFICRVAFNDGVYPGKIIGRNCNISFEGTEIVSPDYELLISQDDKTDTSEGKQP